MDARAVGQFLGLGFKVLRVVKDYLVSAGVARQFGFFFRTGGADHSRTDIVSHLHQQQANASGAGMNERGFTLLQWICAVEQVMRRHALQQCGGCLLVIDLVGYAHQAVLGHSGILGVCAHHAGVSHAISGLE